MTPADARRLAMQLVCQLPEPAADARRVLESALRIVDAMEVLDWGGEDRPARRPTVVSVVPLRRPEGPASA